MQIIAFYNCKGGIGKTTTVANLGYFLAMQKKKVLLVDIDGQANLSKNLFLNVPRGKHQEAVFSYHLVCLEKADIKNAVKKVSGPIYKNYQERVAKYGSLTDEEKEKYPEPIPAVSEVNLRILDKYLYLIPGGEDLAGVVLTLNFQNPAEVSILRKNLRRISPEAIDYILIDCAAGDNPINLTALAAADKVVAPMNCEKKSWDGILQLNHTISATRKTTNPDLEIGGVLITNYENVPSQNYYLDAAKTELGDLCFQSVIRHTRTVASADLANSGFVNEYSPNGLGSIDYKNLAKEFMKRFPSKVEGGK